MPTLFCPKCGRSVSDGYFVCPSCGYQLMCTPSVSHTRTSSGRGFGITSMIMGILSLIYIFPAVLASYFSLGVTIIPITFSVLALIFGFSANSKGYNSGIKTAGIIMSIISLVVNILIIIGA